MAASQLVSPLLEEIRASYGEVFDQALQRNVTDALAEDIGDGDRTGLLVPANVQRTARVTVREEAVLCGVPWFEAVMRRVDESIRVEWLYREGARMNRQYARGFAARSRARVVDRRAQWAELSADVVGGGERDAPLRGCD